MRSEKPRLALEDGEVQSVKEGQERWVDVRGRAEAEASIVRAQLVTGCESVCVWCSHVWKMHACL